MTELIKVFIKMVLAVMAGLYLRKNRVVDERTQTSLGNILLTITLPLAIIASSQYSYSAETAKSMMAVGIGAAIYYLIIMFVMVASLKKSKLDDQINRVFITSSMFGNTAFVGLPIMQELYGPRGLLLAAVFNLASNLFFFSFGVRHISKGKHSLLDLFMNPMSLTSILSIVLFCIPFRMPSFALDSINFIGDMSFPLSMIILGSMLAVTDWKKLFADFYSYIVVILRMVIFPIFMLGSVLLLSRFIEIANTTRLTLVIMSALPCGTLNAIYSEKYNCAPKFCARTVVLSQFFMLITLPVMIFLCTKVL